MTFVRERMFSRPKLSEVLSQLAVLLASRGRLANTLWSITRPVLREGRRELDQMDPIVLELSVRKLRRDPRRMYLREGRKALSGLRCSTAGRGSDRWQRSRRSSAVEYWYRPVTGRWTGDRKSQTHTDQKHESRHRAGELMEV